MTDSICRAEEVSDKNNLVRLDSEETIRTMRVVPKNSRARLKRLLLVKEGTLSTSMK